MGMQEITSTQFANGLPTIESFKPDIINPKVARGSSQNFSTSKPTPNIPEMNIADKDIPDPSLVEAAKAFNNIIDEISSRGISFTKDEGSGRTIIQVIDKNTGDILRQIPPQEYLDMVQKLNKAAELILKDIPKFI